MPQSLLDLSYSEYQRIRFRQDQQLFANPPSGFAVDLLHSGFIYRVPVQMSVITDGRAERIAFNPDMFIYQDVTPPPADAPRRTSREIASPSDMCSR